MKEVQRIIPIFESEKIINLNIYKMGNLLFISFGIDNKTLSSFEKLIEFPNNIIAKEDFRIYCGVKMLYFPRGGNIIKWSSSTTQIVDGTVNATVFI